MESDNNPPDDYQKPKYDPNQSASQESDPTQSGIDDTVREILASPERTERAVRHMKNEQAWKEFMQMYADHWPIIIDD